MRTFPKIYKAYLIIVLNRIKHEITSSINLYYVLITKEVETILESHFRSVRQFHVHKSWPIYYQGVLQISSTHHISRFQVKTVQSLCLPSTRQTITTLLLRYSKQGLHQVLFTSSSHTPHPPPSSPSPPSLPLTFSYTLKSHANILFLYPPSLASYLIPRF